MKTKTLALSLLLTLFGAISWAGCGPDECVAGTQCNCDGDSCDMACGGAGQASCNMNCTNGADCILDCPGGSCNLSCTGAASCELRCGGASCNLSCANTPSCKITECTGSCNLSCGGAGTCSSSCDTAQSCVTSK